MKLDHALVRYLAPAIEPEFDSTVADVTAPAADWRALATPRIRRMWPEIPLEVRCALIESYQKLLTRLPA